jgi:segregation and condensation protein B
METLAVVAYNQPVTRVFVDTIRKVDSSYAMNSLIDRGLIECVGRLDVPGRPMQYGTTSDFLRCFGLKSIEELPSASEELVNMFEKTREKEEEERAVEQEQMTIDEIESSDNGDNSGQNTEATQESEVQGNENLADTSDNNDTNENDDPSAEDDIIDMD